MSTSYDIFIPDVIVSKILTSTSLQMTDSHEKICSDIMLAIKECHVNGTIAIAPYEKC